MIKLFKTVFNKDYGFRKIHTRSYVIKNAQRKTLNVLTVFDDDFRDLWFIFNNTYGKAKNIQRKKDGSFTCTALGKRYFIE